MNGNQQMSTSEWLRKIAHWALVGELAGLGGAQLTWCALLGPVGEKILGFTLEDVVRAALEEYRTEKRRQQALSETAATLKPLPTESILAPQLLNTPPPPPSTASVSNVHKLLVNAVEPEVDGKWRDTLPHPSTVIVLGKRGSGKSALAYRLLELFRYRLSPYVLGAPAVARRLLPDWIGMAQVLEEIPSKSIVLIDEAYLRYHSRESQKSAGREVSRTVNLSRQREQTLIFITPEARQVDKNIVSGTNVVVFKDLGMLQLQFDRRELNKLAAEAKQALGVLSGDRRSWSYVYSPDVDYVGLMKNSLPTFWNSKLSHVFTTGGEPPTSIPPRFTSIEERAEKAKGLRQSGFSFGQIAKTLGVSKGTAYNYVVGCPQKADGGQQS